MLRNLSGEIGATSGKDDATIYALSTAPGRAAIAIIRISGPACLAVWLQSYIWIILYNFSQIYQALCPGRPLPTPRKATLRTLYCPFKHANRTVNYILEPGVLVLYFPRPQTVTGEDVLELHVHGGTAIVKAVLKAIPQAHKNSPHGSRHVVRYAEPGEFTRRAFYDNRLDLTQIEALGDVLSAETEMQRRLALNRTKDGLAKRYEAWRQQLLYARGELEALIDFSEDQHFEESPAKLVSSVAKQVEQLSSRVQASIQNASRGELLRGGISIALVGAPNAGKSSLLNLIVGREAAIVSKEEGTTRDVVEIGVNISGYYCRLNDLAGLRGGSFPHSDFTDTTSIIGEVEAEGIRRAKERALTADVVIVVLSIEPTEKSLDIKLNSEVRATIAKCDSGRQKIICVVNKWDLVRKHGYCAQRVFANINRSVATDRDLAAAQGRVYYFSCEDAVSTAGNIQHLLHELSEVFREMTTAVGVDGESDSRDPAIWEESLGASERQRLLLQQCLDHLNAFVLQVKPSEGQSDSTPEEADIDIVLAAESLRAAADCLAKITGKGETGDVEEVLGVVFEK